MIAMTPWSRLAALILLIAVQEVPSGSDGSVLEGTVHCPSEHPKVVFVEAGDLVSPPPPSAPAVLDQRGLEFIPRVLPVMVGTRVAFINSDPVLHNVFSASKTKLFNLGTYATGVTRYVTFDRPGLVEVLCNVHHEMIAYIGAPRPPVHHHRRRGQVSVRESPRGREPGDVLVRGPRRPSRKREARSVAAQPPRSGRH